MQKNKILIIVLLAVVLVLTYCFLISKKNNTTAPISTSSNTEEVSHNFCDVSSSPHLALMSPRGGELHYQNSAVIIEWHSCNIPAKTHLTIELISVDDPSRSMDLACEDTSWGQPCFVNHGTRLVVLNELFKNGISSGVYTVHIASLEDPNISAVSNPFFISSDNAPILGFTEGGNDINGRHLGYIKNISYAKSASSVTIDYVEWVSPCPENEECPNGYMITNTNHRLRTFPISNTVKISLQTYTHQNSGIDKGNFQWGLAVDLKTFSDFFNKPTPLYSPKDLSFWVTVSNGQVTEITEQYQP